MQTASVLFVNRIHARCACDSARGMSWSRYELFRFLLLVFRSAKISRIKTCIFYCTDTYQTEGSGPGPARLAKASSPAAGGSPVTQKNTKYLAFKNRIMDTIYMTNKVQVSFLNVGLCSYVNKDLHLIVCVIFRIWSSSDTSFGITVRT